MHFLEVELLIDVERLGGFPQHQLELAQSPPPDAGVPGLELGLSLVEEVDEVGRDGQEDGLRRRLGMVLLLLTLH